MVNLETLILESEVKVETHSTFTSTKITFLVMLQVVFTIFTLLILIHFTLKFFAKCQTFNFQRIIQLYQNYIHFKINQSF